MRKLPPTIVFANEIHVLNKKDGSQYPLVLVKDLICIYKGKLIVVPKGYATDFASIPTKWLKRKLEPSKLNVSWKYREGKKFAVWVYENDADGVPQIVGYIEDPVAYAAVIHDWLYSTECVSRSYADRVFFDILQENDVWSSYIMYAAVRLGGWPSFPHKRIEVQEDRQLGRYAYTRTLETLGFTVGNEVELISNLEPINV